MLAVDTNVVVCLLTGDDPDQAERARAIFERRAMLLAHEGSSYVEVTISGDCA